MSKVHIYKTYMFRAKDPIIDETRTIVEDSKLSYKDLHERTGVSVSTLYGWFHGKTRRPSFAAVNAVARACDKTLAFVDMKSKPHLRVVELKRDKTA